MLIEIAVKRWGRIIDTGRQREDDKRENRNLSALSVTTVYFFPQLSQPSTFHSELCNTMRMESIEKKIETEDKKRHR